ncbi:ABC transporter permease subunit [Nocardia sp. NPDC051030]|uniref:ABC transporter permease subunit n=1 Tax=Nocardia sp. NPDC051030 TaxID=3155162 RepID=UPI0034223752
MTATVFTQTLKEQRRALIGWSIGLAIVPLMYLPSYQSLKDSGSLNIQQNDMYKAMGMSDFGSATGYLNATIFSLMGLLLMVIFAVTMAVRTAAQEDSGTLDLLLAQPISRASLLRQRFAALAVQVGVVTTVLGLSVIAGAKAGKMDVPTGNILAAIAGLGLLGLAVAALTLCVGAVTGHRAQTLGGAALLVLTGYLFNSLGAFIDGAVWLQKFSPFHYAVGDTPLVNGWNAGDLGILAALAAAAIAVALTVFDRRDLAV